MARIISAPYGEMRGKLGAVVFTRSRYGMVARSHVVPINPRTTAQVRSRTLFASASQAWCTLDRRIKEAWEEFARQPMRFNPLTRINVGQYSGQAAFISLYMVAARSDQIAANNWPGQVDCTAYQITFEPPGTSVDGAIRTNRGALPLRLESANLDSSGAYSLTFKLDGAPAGGIVIPEGTITDGHGKPFGLGFYMSTPVKNSGNRPAQIYFVHAAQGCPGMATEVITLAGDKLTVSGLVSLPADEYRYGLSGNWVRLTAVQVGQDGTIRVLGATYVQL